MNVTFQQAVMLKELGFNWKVNHGYSRKLHLEPDYSFGNPKGVHSKDPKNYNDNRKGAGKGIQFFSAPRLDQVQKWLRDVKGISVEPLSNLVGQWNVNVCVIGVAGEVLWSKIGCDSYESALSEGIDAAFNLLTEKQ